MIDQLAVGKILDKKDLIHLLSTAGDDEQAYAAACARSVRASVYGDAVYIRGLIEISNICKNDCYYCGIRRSNRTCERYRLSPETILDCCQQGYALGFRTFVLQGGEDAYYTDAVLADIISAIKTAFPDVAVTLSLGERSKASYKRLFEAGADRYLLRHETATASHYAKLHPNTMSFQNRMTCLSILKSIGYQVGCGFMVGSPYQRIDNLVDDLLFLAEFKPDMCGIGPFIPHHATPFANAPAGSGTMTCFLLSLIRLMLPRVLLPATTALGTLLDNGMELGMCSGANVVMPNLSPTDTRSRYELYDNTKSTGAQSAQALNTLRESLSRAGFRVVVDRGDAK